MTSKSHLRTLVAEVHITGDPNYAIVMRSIDKQVRSEFSFFEPSVETVLTPSLTERDAMMLTVTVRIGEVRDSIAVRASERLHGMLVKLLGPYLQYLDVQLF